MISVEAALTQVLDLGAPTRIETVSLSEAAGRVLAEPAKATRDQPPFASSAMDGYAVKAAEVAPDASFKIIGESAAGHRFSGSVPSGEAVRIFTGAPVPDGADRIIIQEDVTRDGDVITLKDNLDPGPYIRPAGGDFRTGAEISAPRRLTPADIALLAAMNVPRVAVHRRPSVALLATGDELVMPGEDPGPDQIIASNGYALAAIVETMGGAPRLLPIARDTEVSLRTAFELAEDADIIVTLGGASEGDHDLVGPVAQAMGMDRAFYKVAMRPGKPLMAGKLGNSTLLGLPGNPVSTLVCAHVFLGPLIAKMLGLGHGPQPRQTAPLTEALGKNGPREHYMRAVLSPDGIRAFKRQDSSLLSVYAEANALLIRPPHDPPRGIGDPVEYLPL